MFLTLAADLGLINMHTNLMLMVAFQEGREQHWGDRQDFSFTSNDMFLFLRSYKANNYDKCQHILGG